MKEALKAIVIVVGILFIWSVVSNLNSSDQATVKSTETTARNGFVSGCKQEAVAYPTIDAESYCQCAYDKLVTMYPDFATNKDRINRILKDGYTPAETDQLAVCATKAQRSET